MRFDGAAGTTVTTVEGVLSGIGHDAIVGEGGQVGQLAFGGATVLWTLSPLSFAVVQAGQALVVAVACVELPEAHVPFDAWTT